VRAQDGNSVQLEDVENYVSAMKAYLESVLGEGLAGSIDGS
jgi:hypothetical protein